MISIAAPAYNEEPCIEKTLDDWIRFLENENFLTPWEIVICNDGSTDGTLVILERMQSKYPSNIKIINFKKNKGAAAALSAAIKRTTKKWVLINDTDGQFPIKNTRLFLNKLKTDTGAVGFKGARITKKDNLFMRLGSMFSGQILNLFYEKSYKDFNSAFMMINGAHLRSLNLEAKGLNYSTEITAKLAEKKIFLEEINISQKERAENVSSKKLIKSAFDRFTFVIYLIFRKALIKYNILTIEEFSEGEPSI